MNSQDTKPGLLVADASGSGRHTLDGLWQQVHCGQRRHRHKKPETDKQASERSESVPRSPLNSFPPASVNSEFMTSSASKPVWPLFPTWVSIRRRTSSSVAAPSSSRMLASDRKLSRSLWARTSSWKFIGFTYWCEPRARKSHILFPEATWSLIELDTHWRF